MLVALIAAPYMTKIGDLAHQLSSKLEYFHSELAKIPIDKTTNASFIEQYAIR